MLEEDAFLRAICENPDEDTPRLAFADWLAEQGGPVNTAWANGIRAQVWLARGDTSAALAQQSRIFESSYGQAKIHERLGVPHWVLQWERGFPTCAVANFQQLQQAWPRLAFRIPIRELNVHGVSEAGCAEFVTWPALSVLSELQLSTAWEATGPSPNVLPMIANCAGLRNLEALTLWAALHSESTVTALLDSPHLIGLKILRLDIDRNTPALSEVLKSRLVARFGTQVFADPIPF